MAGDGGKRKRGGGRGGAERSYTRTRTRRERRPEDAGKRGWVGGWVGGWGGGRGTGGGGDGTEEGGGREGRDRGAGQGGGREEQKMPTGRRQHASFHGHAAADQADSDYPSQFEKADAGPKRRGRLPHTFVGRGWGEEGRGGGEEGRGAAKSSAPIAHAYAHARGANTRTLIHDSRNQALRSGSARYTRKDAKRRRFGYRRGGRRSWSERGE